LSITYLTDSDHFRNDLTEVIEEVEKNPDVESKGTAAMYGIAATIPDRSIVTDFARVFLDTLYKFK